MMSLFAEKKKSCCSENHPWKGGKFRASSSNSMLAAARKLSYTLAFMNSCCPLWPASFKQLCLILSWRSAFKISSRTLLTLTFAKAVVPLRTVHFVEQVPPNLLVWFLS